MIRRYHTAQNFFDGAMAMRESFESHFRRPYEQSPDTHGIWNFWHVPNLYTFLRANPERLFPRVLLDAFIDRLHEWALENLGTHASTPPQLHMYVDGCGQDLHSDFHNGLWGYVFSLTPWDQRNFSGGETLVMRDGSLNYKPHHVHGNDIYELVPQNFNQLLVFDDSIVHGVRTLRGSVVPTEGRLVLTGHIATTDPVVEGSLSLAIVKEWMRYWAPSLTSEIRKYGLVRGWLACGVEVNADGSVRTASVKGNQLVANTGDENAVVAATAAIVELLRRAQFPASKSETSISLPLILPIPNFQPIAIQKTHKMSVSEVRERLHPAFSDAGIELTWDDSTCQIRIPSPWCVGRIEILPTTINLAVDLTMTRPSHRAALESSLILLVNKALQ